MWAYITFIVVCSFLRVVNNFTFWPSVVLGVTISSIFFAIENYFSMSYQTLDTVFDIGNQFVAEEKEQFKLFKKMIDNMAGKVQEASLPEKYEEHLLSGLDEIRNNHISALKEIDDVEIIVNSRKKRAEIFKRIADSMTYLGFICVFFSFVISPEITIPGVFQDILTVLSFAVILITQQIHYGKKEIINDIIATRKLAAKEAGRKRGQLVELENELNKLIIYFQEKEEPADAD